MANITWRDIYNKNKDTPYPNGKPFKDPNLIYPGQVLVMPDDSEYVVKSGDNLTKIANTYNNSKPKPPPPPQNQPTSSTPQPEEKVKPTDGLGVGLPNRRPYNPLGDFSSSTYQISLYMVTPEAANRFIMTGEAQMGNAVGANGESSDGFYLIAQSGGINNTDGAAEGGNKRAPGFDLDFFIDDLKLKTITASQGTGTASPASIDFEFNIYEPYGLSFTSLLTTAAKTVQESTKLPGFEGSANALAQFFVIGIRFYGYDKNGEIYTGDRYVNSDPKRSDNKALFERFYPIKIKSFKFRLDSKMPVYNITAVNLGLQESMGSKRGQIPGSGSITGSTVEEILTGKNGLIQLMNDAETKAAEKRKKEAAKNKNTQATIIANKFNIKFQENSGIGDALMVDPKDFAKYKTNIAMDTAKSTKDSNPSKEAKAKTDKGKKSVVITSGTHIVATIEQIIKQSSYVKNMMSTIQTALSEDDPAVNGNPAEVSWFSVMPGVQVLGKDSLLNDYAYEITYYVQKYTIPFVRTAMVSKTSNYPGPHKKYEYWYTGNNKEVISYEQTYNNLYFLTGVSSHPNQSTPALPKVDKPQPGNQTGAQNKAAEAVNALAVDLYDPGSQAQSKMTILGDPDYLAQNISSSLNDIFKTVTDNQSFTINPVGGQVFIELDFKTATDYNSAGDETTPAGTLSLNQNIRFYDYDPSVKDAIKGITFILKWIHSTFSKGKFTQELDMMPTNLSSFAKKPKSDPSKDKGNRSEAGKGQKKNGKSGGSKTRKEYADHDPRRTDNPNQTANTQARTGVNLSNNKAGGGRGSGYSSQQHRDDDNNRPKSSQEAYNRDAGKRDPVTLLPKR